MWMNLEPAIQGEVSQNEKSKKSYISHIYRIWKKDNDKSICSIALEMQT